MAKTRAPEPKPQNSVYTGILMMSFLALASVSVLLYFEYDKYKKSPEKVHVNVPGQTAGKAGIAK
jgi:hypothetical protein